MGLLALGVVGRATATTFLAAGDGEQTWLLLAAGDDQPATWALYHRERSDASDALERVGSLYGPVESVAATQGRLWLFDADRELHTAKLAPPDEPTLDRLTLERRPSLPPGTVLRRWGAWSEGVYALVRVENRRVLEELGALGSARAEPDPSEAPGGVVDTSDGALNLSLGLPPKLRVEGPSQARSDAEPGAPDAGDSAQAGDGEEGSASSEAGEENEPSADGEPLPVDRLLWLNRDHWEPVALPEDWPHLAPAAVVLRDGSAESLVLVARPTGSSGELSVYERVGEGWERTDYPLTRSGPFRALSVQGQLVVAVWGMTRGGLEVEAHLLREGRRADLGTVRLEEAPLEDGWAMVPSGLGLTLLAQAERYTPSPRAWPTDPIPTPLRAVTLDLRGTVKPEVKPVGLVESAWWDQAAQQLVMLVLLVVMIAMVFMFWRRDPRSIRVSLPKGVALADLGRRAGAGTIDLVPAAVVPLVAYGTSLPEMARHWPGAAISEPEAMLPGATAIGLFVLHTTVTELITQRTLGKAIMGLRVTGMRGERPSAGRIVTRGALKALDLIAWLLLILPLIGMYRQRLGDVIAQTIVVMPAPPRPEEESADDDESDDKPD